MMCQYNLLIPYLLITVPGRLLIYTFTFWSVIAGCTSSDRNDTISGNRSVPPPEFLTDLHGTDFTYVEYDSLLLNRLPIIDAEIEPFMSDDEFGELSLNRIQSIYPIESGKKWLFQNGYNFPHILWKDTDGFRVLPLGREGNGPGEFMRQQMITHSYDGTYIWINTYKSLMQFSSDGTFIQQAPHPYLGAGYKIDDVFLTNAPMGDSLLAVIRSLENDTDPLPCLPEMPARHPDLVLPFDLQRFYTGQTKQIISIYNRFPFIVFTGLHSKQPCTIQTIINLEPAYTEGTGIRTERSGTAAHTYFSTLISSAAFVDGCWLVSTRLIPENFLQICDTQPVNRIRLTKDGTHIKGFSINGVEDKIVHLRPTNSTIIEYYLIRLP